MIGRTVNERLRLNASHAYYFYLGNWYHNLQRFPGILIDRTGYVRFETQTEYDTNPHLQHGSRLHVRDGISSMPNYVSFTEEQLFILNQILGGEIEADTQNINRQAERRPRNIDSIDRNQNLVRRVKRIHNNTCQICSLKLQIGPNSYYSEVHHIKPLGRPHNGPDVISNMICVCPNCHIILDYGFAPIDINKINVSPKHLINIEFIDYHNARI